MCRLQYPHIAADTAADAHIASSWQHIHLITMLAAMCGTPGACTSLWQLQLLPHASILLVHRFFYSASNNCTYKYASIQGMPAIAIPDADMPQQAICRPSFWLQQHINPTVISISELKDQS
jgi:hypothetical protein